MKIKSSTIACANKVCSLCLAMISLIHFSGVSFLFFGEPSFPDPKDC